jgi:hypothetical protein
LRISDPRLVDSAEQAEQILCWAILRWDQRLAGRPVDPREASPWRIRAWAERLLQLDSANEFALDVLSRF